MSTFAWTSNTQTNFDPEAMFTGIVGDDLNPEVSRSTAHLFRSDGTVLELHGSDMSKFPSPSGTPGQGPWIFHGTVFEVVFKDQNGNALADIIFPTTSIGTFCGSTTTPPFSQTYRSDALQTLLVGNDTISDQSASGHILKGLTGNDILDGGTGNDTLIGGTGDDRFIFAPGYGADTIIDSIPGANSDDRVVLTAFTNIHTLADVLALATQNGNDTVLNFGNGDTLTLQGVSKASLSADDFVEGLFQEALFKLASFGASADGGGWSSNDKYPRLAADVNGDGRADLVGFGDDGVFVSLANSDGSFRSASFKLASFGASASGGGWSSDDKYPRQLADVNGDGRADIVGFGDAGVTVALAKSDGSFQSPSFELASFGASASGGGWSSEDKYPRQVGDVNGDGRADLVGFGDDGVFVALGTSDGSFQSPAFELASFGASASGGGWSSDDKYPRRLADVNGDGHADIVGFGDGGVFVALASGEASFQSPSFKLASFGASASGGGWSSDDKYPRLVADVNGDGMADIIGFGEGGVYAALATGNGSFSSVTFDRPSFGSGPSAGGWSSNNLFPRVLADVTGDGSADIVGFGDAGVFVSHANGFVLS